MQPPGTTVLVAASLVLALASPPTKTTILPSAVRWSIEISASPAAPPVVALDKVFVVLQSGVVAAYNIADHTEAWHVSQSSDLPVAADDERVYVSSGASIFALNAADGAVVWQADSGAVTAPLLAHAGWLVAATATGIAAYRAADGVRMWTHDLGPVKFAPSLEGDNLYVPLQDGRLLSLQLPSGEERWSKNWGVASEVLALPDRIYVGGAYKDFYCLRADTGEIEWRGKLGALIRGRAAADDTRIYITSMDNTLRAYRRSNGELLWHPSVPFRPTTGPLLIEGAVVVAGNSAEVRAFEPATGKPAGQITLPEVLAMPPSFGRSGDLVVMAAFTGSLTSQWKLVLTAPPPPVAGVPPG